MSSDEDLDFDDMDDVESVDDELFEEPAAMKAAAQKMALDYKRKIADRLEMLKWKREYGLSDEDFNELLNDH